MSANPAVQEELLHYLRSLASCLRSRKRYLCNDRVYVCLICEKVAFHASNPFGSRRADLSQFGVVNRSVGPPSVCSAWRREAPSRSFAGSSSRMAVPLPSRMRSKRCFPGRFKKVKPAAVELHATLDLLDESLSKVTLTADTASERAALPKASSLGGSLLLADRGYFDRDYLSELTKAGASFVIRAPKGLNPKVLEAFDAKGQRIRQFCGKPLKTLRIAKRGAVDLQVRWEVPGQSLECRLIVAWNAAAEEFQYLATNLPPGRYSVSEVAKAYRLRWQVELLFKEWKSYANLHAFDTQNTAIVEGLIWAAIGAAALKRFLAHTAQVVAGVETSTRKAAMCAVHVLQDILRTLISGIENRFLDAFARAIDYLAGNARRAHPKRDRQRGRLQFGLQPILANP